MSGYEIAAIILASGWAIFLVARGMQPPAPTIIERDREPGD